MPQLVSVSSASEGSVQLYRKLGRVVVPLLLVTACGQTPTAPFASNPAPGGTPAPPTGPTAPTTPVAPVLPAGVAELSPPAVPPSSPSDPLVGRYTLEFVLTNGGFAGAISNVCASMPDPVRTRTYTADIEIKTLAEGSRNYAVTLYDAAFPSGRNRFLASNDGSGALSFDLNEPFGDVFFPRIWVYYPNGHWLQIAGAAQGTVGSGYGRIDADGSGSVWYSDDLPYADSPRYCSFRLTFTRR